MKNDELQKALLAAASVIEQLDNELSRQGKGRNLSAVPSFEGQDFVELLRGLGKVEEAPDYSWVEFLPEVGSPVSSHAEELGYRHRQAAERLNQAHQSYQECLEGIAADAKALEKKVASLWSPAEIALAKRMAAAGVPSPGRSDWTDEHFRIAAELGWGKAVV
jgi:hypothetical protein